jgi:hypothetical protein
MYCADGTVTGWPGVYCSIDPGPPYGIQQVLDAVTVAGQLLPRHWFIAWYTRNGAVPTAADVVAEIFRITSLRLDPADIWACQYATGLYDTSVVYQNPAWA